MATIATVWITESKRISRRNEIERMVARFTGGAILAGFWHMALDAAAAGTCRRMMRMIGNGLILWSRVFSRAVAGQAQGIRIR